MGELLYTWETYGSWERKGNTDGNEAYLYIFKRMFVFSSS